MLTFTKQTLLLSDIKLIGFIPKQDDLTATPSL